jgi:hypothetical protein
MLSRAATSIVSFDANGILLKIEPDISRAGNNNDNGVPYIGAPNEVTEEMD